jgi:hypothetical protein
MQLKQMAPWLRPRGKFKANEREPIRTWTIVKGDKVDTSPGGFPVEQLVELKRWQLYLYDKGRH